MKLFVFYNMEKTKLGRKLMQGFPAKYHALFGCGLMTFTGPKERVSESLVKHELIHHYQAEREGWIRWNFNYYRQTYCYGYLDNIYEVEAYDGMHEPLTEEECLICGLVTAEDMLDIFNAIDREYPLRGTSESHRL